MLPFFWKNDVLYILDQRKLPFERKYYKCLNYKDVVKCIKQMVVRGAPAIGLVGGWAVVLAVKEAKLRKFKLTKFIEDAVNKILSSRPTAYNLFYVVNRLKEFILSNENAGNLYELTLNEMVKIQNENSESLMKLVKFGVELLNKNSVVLTHCNTGALACGDVGTALGIIIEGYKKGKVEHVYVDETRPYLQGAKLTVLELMTAGVPSTMITDNMAAYVIKQKGVDCIIVGADRIAKNGDTANKIGTYNLAILAKYHNIPFYVAAPFSSIDVSIPSGEYIKIEERSDKEVKYINNKLITLKNAKVLHPAFDVTPSELITAIITDCGVYKSPYNFARI
ncbi:MAG: S-methyl-5-thioribose-1-phosphate isomerase [Elusimicrobiota bacterium]|nr:S-methyl-5-thioribose-1-phosphate isomerase [Elusimicrobiota bacterium]